MSFSGHLARDCGLQYRESWLTLLGSFAGRDRCSGEEEDIIGAHSDRTVTKSDLQPVTGKATIAEK